MVKTFAGFKIGRGYVRATVWEFAQSDRRLVATMAIIPNKNITRREKFEVICEHLKNAGIPRPSYRDKN